MKIIAETPRLVLRTFTIDDAKMFYDLCKDPEVVKYVGEAPLQSVEQAQKILNEKILKDQYEKFGYGRWAIHLKKNGIFIGWCGLKNENGEIDLGYRLKKRFWGKGFITEAAEAVLRYGFETLDLEKIHASAMQENIASIAVMKKIGREFIDNRPFDAQEGVYYEITRDRWKKRNL